MTQAKASAPAAAWDQPTVTDLADQFSKSADALFREISRSPSGTQRGTGQAQSYLRLKDRLRVARNEARHLAKSLSEGKNKDETFHTWERLMSLIRDAREVGRAMFLEAPTQEKIEKARGLLDQLTPYYEAKKSG